MGGSSNRIKLLSIYASQELDFMPTPILLLEMRLEYPEFFQ